MLCICRHRNHPGKEHADICIQGVTFIAFTLYVIYQHYVYIDDTSIFVVWSCNVCFFWCVALLPQDLRRKARPISRRRKRRREAQLHQKADWSALLRQTSPRRPQCDRRAARRAQASEQKFDTYRICWWNRRPFPAAGMLLFIAP